VVVQVQVQEAVCLARQPGRVRVVLPLGHQGWEVMRLCQALKGLAEQMEQVEQHLLALQSFPSAQLAQKEKQVSQQMHQPLLAPLVWELKQVC
jgi:hypothetical protein